MRDYERYMYKLVSTAFADILCFGVPRCCVAPNDTLA